MSRFGGHRPLLTFTTHTTGPPGPLGPLRPPSVQSGSTGTTNPDESKDPPLGPDHDGCSPKQTRTGPGGDPPLRTLEGNLRLYDRHGLVYNPNQDRRPLGPLGTTQSRGLEALVGRGVVVGAARRAWSRHGAQWDVRKRGTKVSAGSDTGVSEGSFLYPRPTQRRPTSTRVTPSPPPRPLFDRESSRTGSQ